MKLNLLELEALVLMLAKHAEVFRALCADMAVDGDVIAEKLSLQHSSILKDKGD